MSILDKLYETFAEELTASFDKRLSLRDTIRFLELTCGYSSIYKDLRKSLTEIDVYYPVEAVTLRIDEVKNFIGKDNAFICQFEHFLKKPFVWYYPGQMIDGWDDVPRFCVNDVIDGVDLGYDFSWLRERLINAINSYDLFIEYLNLLFDNKGKADGSTYIVDCGDNTFKFEIVEHRIYLDLLSGLNVYDFGEVNMEYVSLTDLLVKLDGLALIAKNF